LSKFVFFLCTIYFSIDAKSRIILSRVLLYKTI
jgi:hypothetical protein